MIRWADGLRTCLLAITLVMVGGLLHTESAEAACCTGRECTEDNLIICVLKGGNWSPLPCVPLVTCALTGPQGACCNPLIGCSTTTSGLCFGNFMEEITCDEIGSCRNLPPRGACCGLINACSETIEAGCDGFGKSFVEGASCSDNLCGVLGPEGACCIGGTCQPLTGIVCSTLGGRFTPGRTCAEVNQCRPVEVTGACCSEGTCNVTTEATCDSNGGIFAEGLDCSIADLCALPEPEGACCTAGGACVESKEADCLAGSFQLGESCATDGVCDHMIPPKTGACCLGDRCEELTNAQCNSSGGAYEGDDTSCATTTCVLPPSEGACCSPTGCSEGPESTCPVGTWHENGSCVQPGLCAPPPEIACCNGYSCSMMTEEGCTLGGGTPTGASCSAGLCGTPAGACCVDEVCTGDDVDSCEGSFVEGVECPAFDCTGRGIIGGCCLPSGRCEDATRAACDFNGGSWGADRCDVRDDCDDNLPEGACCEGEQCRLATATTCGGTFSEGMICADVACGTADSGSCCAGGSCTLGSEAACADLGGVFNADGDCSDLELECPGAVRGACCAN